MFKTTSLVYVGGVIGFLSAIIIFNNPDLAPDAAYFTTALGYFICCYARSSSDRRIERRYGLTD